MDHDSQFAALTDSTLPHWVPQLTHSATGLISHANDAFFQLLGYTSLDFSPVTPLSLFDLTPSQHHTSDRRYLETAGTTHTPLYWHKRFRHRDGTQVLVLYGTHSPDGIHFTSIAPPVKYPTGQSSFVAHLLHRDDHEKQTLARKLHNTTAQNLAALAINLSILPTLPPGSAQTQRVLDECNALTAASLAEIRSISYRLHPPLLEELGLLPALRTYTHAYTTSTSIDVQLNIPDYCERLAPHIETTLFRIIQERLTYLETYGDATECNISFICENARLTLVITDNSDPNPDPSFDAESYLRLSLSILHERANTISAAFAVENDSRSTTIRAIISRS